MQFTKENVLCNFLNIIDMRKYSYMKNTICENVLFTCDMRTLKSWFTFQISCIFHSMFCFHMLEFESTCDKKPLYIHWIYVITCEHLNFTCKNVFICEKNRSLVKTSKTFCLQLMSNCWIHMWRNKCHTILFCYVLLSFVIHMRVWIS